MNILREICTGSLRLNDSATCILLSRTIWHVGEKSEDYFFREANEVFNDRNFISTFFSMIQACVNQFEMNWEKVKAMEVMILLIIKVMSFCENSITADGCYALLQHIRNVLFGWISKLEGEVARDLEEKRICAMRHSASLYQLTFDGPATCVQFDYDFDCNVKIFLKSTMIMQDRMPENMTKEIRNSIIRSVRATVRYERRIIDWIRRDPQELSQLLSSKCKMARDVKRWSVIQDDPHPGSDPRRPRSPGDRVSGSGWVIGAIDDGIADEPPEILFNYLTGSCFVNGRPVQRLPNEYTQHHLYRRLFQTSTFDIVLSDDQSMSYMTANRIFGWSIYFSMDNCSDLIVRIKKDDQFFEVIPHSKFRSELPRILLDDYVHLLDVRTKTLEFRPLNCMWEGSKDNWCIEYSSRDAVTLRKRDARLFDFRGATYQQISKVFSGLEDKESILATYVPVTGEINIQFPRFGLTFWLNNQRQFECREIQCVLDVNQDAGTLYGLKSKMVLKSTVEDLDFSRRRIIIPYGRADINRSGEHVSIRINPTESAQKEQDRPYLLLEIDPILGRLHSDNNIRSRLFLAYLHAVTSGLFPDPLTGLVGITEALRLLSQKSIHSSSPHSAEDVALLELIQRLAPRIEFSSKYEIAQTYKWSNETSLHSQLAALCFLAQNIDSETKKLMCLYPHVEGLGLKSYGNLKLLARHRALIGWLYPNDISTSSFPSPNPVVNYEYVEPESKGNSKAYQFSFLLRQWPSGLDSIPTIWPLITELKLISGLRKPFTWEYMSLLLQLPIMEHWGPLFKLCFHAQPQDRYSLSFLFATLIYSDDTLLEHCKFLLSCALCNFSSLSISGPKHHEYDLTKGEKPNFSQVDAICRRYRTALESSPSSPGQSERKKNAKLQRTHEENEAGFEEAKNHLRQLVQENWENGNSQLSDVRNFVYIDMAKCISSLNEFLLDWVKNREFHRLIMKILVKMENLKDSKPLPELPELTTTWPPPQPKSHTFDHIQLSELMIQTKGVLADKVISFQNIQASAQHTIASLSILEPKLSEIAREYRNSVDIYWRELSTLLRPNDDFLLCVLWNGFLYPKISIYCLLDLLSQKSWITLPNEWRNALSNLALGLTIHQKFKRLVSLQTAKDEYEFGREVNETGHENWSIREHPEWLLLELECNIMIRKLQSVAAIESVLPSSGANSLLQLNMGEGKTSVIVPMVVVALADGENLVRVFVPKPLGPQMIKALQRALGGLLDRRIYHLPFSRNTDLEIGDWKKITGLFDECLRTGGVLVAYPEQSLSFKLLGQHKLLQNRKDGPRPCSEAVTILMERQQWLQNHARDILDESDEILSPKFELVYTRGVRQSIDYQPQRWAIVAEVLDLVSKVAGDLVLKEPGSFEYRKMPEGRFAPFRILQKKGGLLLVDRIVQEISEGLLPCMSLRRCNSATKSAALTFIGSPIVDPESRETVIKYFTQTEEIKTIVLLRGLLGYGLLEAALNSRWSVNYGVDLNRDLKMSVPYRAKGVPSVNAEFADPDAAILLTYLSYYYTGLKEDQLLKSFQVLLQTAERAVIFEQWVKSASTPLSFRALENVNLQDQGQFRNVYRKLRYQKSVIDFYLDREVFYRETKIFPEKLSTSAWDIPMDTRRLTTGFSGTKVTGSLLPKSIAQRNVSELESHGEEMLQRIQSQEDDVYLLAADENGNSLDAKGLLKKIIETTNVKVLIDVGAQIVEMTNEEVAKTWLALDHDAEAAVYFDERDEIVVRRPSSRTEKLSSSPLKDRIDQCVFYLDEAHTRGTDLQFPVPVRAAVTLGPLLTQDRFIQACMRLRKLGRGQSIVCLSPPETHRRILEIAKKRQSMKPTIEDVLDFTKQEATLWVEKHRASFIKKGLDHCRRHHIYEVFTNGGLVRAALNNKSAVREFKFKLPELEEVDLLQKYSESSTQRGLSPFGFTEFDIRNDRILFELVQEWKTLKDETSAQGDIMSTRQNEIFHQAQEERSIERPNKAEPVELTSNPDLEKFVATGILDRRGEHISPAFHTLLTTSAEDRIVAFLRNRRSNTTLFVTTNFDNTVKVSTAGRNDDYLRPVQWVVSSNIQPDQGLLLISPEEANHILPDVRRLKNVSLHVYTARTSKTMPSFDNLDFYYIPSDSRPNISHRSILDLFLFSGSIYLPSFEFYIDLCKYLGILSSKDPPIPAETGIEVQPDGFISPGDRALLGWEADCPFRESPLPFVSRVIAARRKGDDYSHSHMAKILRGEDLYAEDFEFRYPVLIENTNEDLFVA